MDFRDMAGFTVVFLALLHAQGLLLPGTRVATNQVEAALTHHAAGRDAHLRRLGIEAAAARASSAATPVMLATAGPRLLDHVAR
jgi:hypothetical protein